MRSQTTDQPCPDGTACPTTLGSGVPDLCVGGYTLVTVTECDAANPTVAQACATPELRALIDCTYHPLTLPQTGTATMPIAGTGLLALVAGAVLLRVSSRRAVARPARR